MISFLYDTRIQELERLNMVENVTKKTGKIVEGIKKGAVGEANIIRITDGIAADFMTPEQIVKRQTDLNTPFTEIELVINGTILTKTFKDYTRVADGGIPQNSTMGKIMGVCDLEEDGKVPMIAREIDGRNGRMVVWDIAF